MQYHKKTIIVVLFFVCQLTLTCCRGDWDCNYYTLATEEENLLSLTPIQSNYNQGDVVTLKGIIPSVNNYFVGQEVNLFGQTNDYSALLILQFNELFIGNELTFISGSQGEHKNWFEVPYNPNTGNYEFEVKVKLNKAGHYFLSNSGEVYFQESNVECIGYVINTTVSWIPNSPIEFDVE